MAEFAPTEQGFKVAQNLGGYGSLASSVDLEGIKAFVNKYTNALPVSNKVSLHTKDKRLGLDVSNQMFSDRNEQGLAAYFKGDEWGVDGSRTKSKPTYGPETTTSSLGASYNPDSNIAYSVEARRRNNDKPNITFTLNKKF